MAKVHLTKRLRHTPAQMLSLVADVEKYPNFINLISAVRILEKTQISDTQEKFVADVNISYKIFSETFRSIVEVDRKHKTLNIKRAGHGGAVKSLMNIWVFKELKDGTTELDFKLDVRLKALPLEFLIKQKLHKATNTIIEAFERRAAQLFPLIGEDTPST
ncbi:MAG: hypothetical protein COA43_01250 [Robiginitomaculum sp.]|nr:MAG: hypothetical protein COA43_01250 [Robiginitomaculum sp.]